MANANSVHFLKQNSLKCQLQEAEFYDGLETFFPSQSKEEEEVVALISYGLVEQCDMFRTILSFCSMLTRDFSCVMLRGSCSNRLLSKNLAVQNKNCRKVMFRRHCTGFFSVQCCLESLGQHCTRFLPVQCCPKSINTILNRLFSCALLS